MSKNSDFIAGLSGSVVYEKGTTFSSETVGFPIRGVTFAEFPATISIAKTKDLTNDGSLTDIRKFLNCTKTDDNIVVNAPSPFFRFPFDVHEFECDVNCTFVKGSL